MFAERRAEADPQASYEAREVYAAVAALPDDFRDVIVAVDVARLSCKEAAKAFKTPEGTVMSRLHRARSRWRRRSSRRRPACAKSPPRGA